MLVRIQLLELISYIEVTICKKGYKSGKGTEQIPEAVLEKVIWNTLTEEPDVLTPFNLYVTSYNFVQICNL